MLSSRWNKFGYYLNDLGVIYSGVYNNPKQHNVTIERWCNTIYDIIYDIKNMEMCDEPKKDTLK